MSNKLISNISKFIIISAIIVGVIFAFTMISNAGDAKGISERNREEISYLDSKLLTLINYLNNIDMQNYQVVLTKVESESSTSSSSAKKDKQSNEQEDTSENGTDKEEKTLSKMEKETIVLDNEKIDWKTIEGELEVLSSTWSNIVLDLYKIDVKAENILAFSNDLDEAIINIKNKEKALSAMYIAKLYSYLPEFLDKTLVSEIEREALQAKTHIVNAYAYAETKNWDKINVEIQKAETIFTSLVNDTENIENQRKYNVNKAYILIEELKNSLEKKNLGIFYLKYKNVLEELNILT